ncbi:MAG: Rv3235 family protein [Aquiluna sp.]|nr:Rv3235 family protein [Aquiluna sp.]
MSIKIAQQNQNNPASFFAEISTAYIEILAGVRRPEQLSRWLSDKAYYDVSQRSRRNSRHQAITGKSMRPTIVIRTSKVFPTDSDAFQGVVLLDISGAIRAVSVRAELIHDRFRITEIVLITP